MPGRRVVITGVGVVTSLGSSIDEFWKNLCDGKSGISEIESFDSSRFKTHFAGEIKNFEPNPIIDLREQKRIERFSQFALLAAVNAIDDAQIDFSKEDPFRCGVVLGSGVGGLREIEKAVLDLTKVHPLLIPKSMPNAAAGVVSIKFGLKGPNGAIATACASASNAIGDAMRIIRQGEADIMISGGSEAAICALGLGGFCAMRALSTRNQDPQSASRPFDASRDGFVLSEGSGIIVLEEYDHAKARGAKIYGELLGYGSTQDGMHITAPDPEGSAAATAMRTALHDAGIEATDIDYVNAHGTGTPLGDLAETVAMKKVFQDHSSKVSISSTKSQLGHMLGASGGVELVVTSLSLDRGEIPPTINLHSPDPNCDLDYTPNEAKARTIKFAMSNSFGFGGHNASLVIGKPDVADEVRSQRRAA